LNANSGETFCMVIMAFQNSLALVILQKCKVANLILLKLQQYQLNLGLIVRWTKSGAVLNLPKLYVFVYVFTQFSYLQ
jgi:hypothetical protein